MIGLYKPTGITHDGNMFSQGDPCFIESFEFHSMFPLPYVSASKEGVVHNRSFFVILTTDSFEALFISYFKPAGIW